MLRRGSAAGAAEARREPEIAVGEACVHSDAQGTRGGPDEGGVRADAGR